MAEETGEMIPKLVAIVGDSAAGKSTLARGLRSVLGDRCTSFCTDNYHRWDRAERLERQVTALHPDANYVDIMEQQLHLLATGHTILAPTYDHATGRRTRPQLVEPREFVIVDGLLALYTKASRACFDATVYVDQPEPVRKAWKLARDTSKRGYSTEEVHAELVRREPDSQLFIQPQKRYANVVLRYEPVQEPWHEEDPLSATLSLRPTIDYPNLAKVLTDDDQKAVHIQLTRDSDANSPIDTVHINGWTPEVVTRKVQEDIWASTGLDGGDLHSSLGVTNQGVRSEPLALAQLILLSVLLQDP